MDADCGRVESNFMIFNDICLPYLADLTNDETRNCAGCRVSSAAG